MLREYEHILLSLFFLVSCTHTSLPTSVLVCWSLPGFGAAHRCADKQMTFFFIVQKQQPAFTANICTTHTQIFRLSLMRSSSFNKKRNIQIDFLLYVCTRRMCPYKQQTRIQASADYAEKIG